MSTPQIASAYRSGKQALTAAHRAQVDDDGADLYGSVNIDDALKTDYPASPRWDYAVSHSAAGHDAEFITWIEVHPATPGCVQDILNKRAALDQWLAGAGRSLAAFASVHVWIASGSVGIPKNAPELRRLALRRIKGPCKYYRLRRQQCS